MKKFFLISIVLIPFLSFSQEKKMSEKQKRRAEKAEKINQLIKQEEEGALIYQKQSAFLINLNTDGYGITYEHGKYKSLLKTNLWWLSLTERKHPKEEKFSTVNASTGFIVGNPYIYGKINNFYNFKIGVGQQYLIGGKGNKNGVATTLVYGGGLTVALLKPYYLDVKDALTGRAKSISYADDNKAFLDGNNIIGSTGFSKGFNNLKYVPGAQVRTALRFDYGRYNEIISAIETGVNAEFYSQKIEHMAYTSHKNFFFNAYISIVFGKRK